ncbi:hypothetical protein CVT25_013790 [Psilocybe cyanescens]|uniref:Uncharacterized protein n=1 Tax=Psilocybe cyanescens TaxID=93625 RepID=A0A409WTU0_PSICY|nr:hypothetical protein CVT25_013790 [Psilocybe cyanescens]
MKVIHLPLFTKKPSTYPSGATEINPFGNQTELDRARRKHSSLDGLLLSLLQCEGTGTLPPSLKHKHEVASESQICINTGARGPPIDIRTPKGNQQRKSMRRGYRRPDLSA